MNSKQQGDIGVAKAIYYYTSQNYTVSIPNTDNSKYDLIVDKDNQLYRVQVKTTTHKAPSGSYHVELRTMGGNQSWSGTYKKISSNDVDLLFVACEDGSIYEFNSNEINEKTSITLGKLYDSNKVALDRW